MTLAAQFGLVLQQLRHRRQLSQEQLAFHSGYHRTYVSLLERGLKSPTLAAIFQLAAALETSPSELIRAVEVRVEEAGLQGAPSHENRPRRAPD